MPRHLSRWRNMVFPATVDGRLVSGCVAGFADGATAPERRAVLLSSGRRTAAPVCFSAEGKLKKVDSQADHHKRYVLLRGTSGRTRRHVEPRRHHPLTRGRRIYRVPAAGGEPTPVFGTDQANYTNDCLPSFLPDGRHFLYLRTAREEETSEVYLASLDGKEPTRLLAADSQAVYAASGTGYLLFAREGHAGATVDVSI